MGNKLTIPQLNILETVAHEPMTVIDLANETRFSASYVRAQIKLLEATGRIERVDNRMPYMYQVPQDSPFLRHRDRITKYRQQLVDASNSENSFVKLLSKAPKSEWVSLAEELRALSDAIDVLNDEGKLIETLEGAL